MENKHYINERDLFEFQKLLHKTNLKITLKEGWKGNGIYDFESKFLCSYLDWKKWELYLLEVLRSTTS